MAKAGWKTANSNRQIAKGNEFPVLLFSWFAFCFLPLAFCLLLSYGCKNKVGPGTAAVSRPLVEGAKIATVQLSEADETFETAGTIKAKNISRVASRMMGTVTSLRVNEGDHVRAGQILMTIDNRDVQQKVLAAEKAVDAAQQNRSMAEITYKRYKQIYDEKALSQQELDQIETQKKVADLDYERAKAMLAEARVNLSFANIVSPVSGVVTQKKTERGSMAVPGDPLLVVEDTSSYQFEIHPDERVSGKIRVGMPVKILIESIGKELAGRVSEIIPSVDPMSHTFTAKIDVSGQFLRTGLYANALISMGKKKAILLPESSIVEKGQLAGVYAVDSEGIVSYRLIRTGRHYGPNVEILSGINPNEKVIVDGVAGAVDGGIVSEGKK